jgi:hypothetical protein
MAISVGLLGSALPQPDALGRAELKGAIYDSLTFRQLSNGAWEGDMFPNNTIPVSRFSAVSQKLNAIAKADYLPQVPMVNGQYPLTKNGYFPLATQPILDHYTFAIKIDRNISDRQEISGFYNAYKPWENNDQGGLWDINDPYGGQLSKARWQRGLGQLSRINYDYTLNAAMMNHVTINYNRYTNPSINTNASVDGCAQLGITGIKCTGYPYINWGAGPAFSIANPVSDVIHNVVWGFGDTSTLPTAATS